MAIFPNLIYRFSTISVKILNVIFADMDKLILKFIRKWKEPKIAKQSWKRIKLQDSHFWFLKLSTKLQYFGHLIQRADSMEKTLMLGKIEGNRRRGWQRMRSWMASLTQWTWLWANWGRKCWTDKCAAVHGVAKSRT